MPRPKFNPEHCDECTQSTEYKLGLDKGSAKIVLAIVDIIKRKPNNEIHPANELDSSGHKKWYLTNLSRPRFHGLIAYVEDKPGYYCLTRKAGKFLRNKEVWKFAIIDKITGHKKRYWQEGGMTTIGQLLKQEIQWEGDTQKLINYLDPQTGQDRLF